MFSSLVGGGEFSPSTNVTCGMAVLFDNPSWTSPNMGARKVIGLSFPCGGEGGNEDD